MEVSEILKKLATKHGKNKGSLTKTFNSIVKAKKKETGGVLDEELITKLGLLGVCKRYEIDPEDLEVILKDRPTREEPVEERLRKFDEENNVPYIEPLLGYENGTERMKGEFCIKAGITMFKLEKMMAEYRKEHAGKHSDEAIVFQLDNTMFPEPSIEPKIDVVSEVKVIKYRQSIIKKTGLTREEIDERVQQKKEELKGLISEEGALFIIAKELSVEPEVKIKKKRSGKKMVDMTDFFGDYEPEEREKDEEDTGFAKTESLKPKLNLEYHVYLSERTLENGLYEHVGRNYKNTADESSWVMNLYVVRVPKKDDRYVKGQEVAFWMNKMANESFFKFWRDVVGSKPDDRVFSIEKSQKKTKKGYNMNVWTFSEV